MPNYARQLDDQLDQFNRTGTQKRAAIYARVSTLEQAEEGYSIDEQVRVLREVCEREGYVVHKNMWTGGKAERTSKGDLPYNNYCMMLRVKTLTWCSFGR